MDAVAFFFVIFVVFVLAIGGITVLAARSEKREAKAAAERRRKLAKQERQAAELRRAWQLSRRPNSTALNSSIANIDGIVGIIKDPIEPPDEWRDPISDSGESRDNAAPPPPSPEDNALGTSWAQTQAATEKTLRIRCSRCRHVQPVPLSVATFQCEQCGVKLRRRTTPA